MNPTHQTDLRTLLLEVLSDNRLLALLQYWRKLGTRQKRLLLRLTRTLAR